MSDQRELIEYSVEIERHEQWREGYRREVIARFKVEAVDDKSAALVGEAIEYHISAEDRSASFYVNVAPAGSEAAR